jgi:hypothetical protein
MLLDIAMRPLELHSHCLICGGISEARLTDANPSRCLAPLLTIGRLFGIGRTLWRMLD